MGLSDKFSGPAGAGRHNDNTRIETPRTILREFDPVGDKKRLIEITNSPGFEYYCFDGSEEKVDTYMEKCTSTRQVDPETGVRTHYMMAITDRQTGDLIGGVSLEHKSFVDQVMYEVNFFVDTKYQNKGLGREAVVNMMHYGFDTLGLPHINVTIEPTNGPSLAVAHREGYREVGEVMIHTPCYGDRLHLVLLLDKDTFYSNRAQDRTPLILRPGNDNGPKGPAPAP